MPQMLPLSLNFKITPIFSSYLFVVIFKLRADILKILPFNEVWNKIFLTMLNANKILLEHNQLLFWKVF